MDIDVITSWVISPDASGQPSTAVTGVGSGRILQGNFLRVANFSDIHEVEAPESTKVRVEMDFPFGKHRQVETRNWDVLLRASNKTGGDLEGARKYFPFASQTYLASGLLSCVASERVPALTECSGTGKQLVKLFPKWEKLWKVRVYLFSCWDRHRPCVLYQHSKDRVLRHIFDPFPLE